MQKLILQLQMLRPMLFSNVTSYKKISHHFLNKESAE